MYLILLHNLKIILQIHKTYTICIGWIAKQSSDMLDLLLFSLSFWNGCYLCEYINESNGMVMLYVDL